MTFSQIILQIILGLGTNHNAAIGDFHLQPHYPTWPGNDWHSGSWGAWNRR